MVSPTWVAAGSTYFSVAALVPAKPSACEEAASPALVERARDEAHGFLVVLGAAMVHQIIRDAANGSAALLQWYLKFVGGLDHRTRLAWSELDYVLTEESLPLYEAWLTNEETEEAAVLGRVLKDVSWQ